MRKIAKLIQAITYWPIYLSLKFFTRFEVRGQENLKGLEKKAVIFASNHTSYIDGPIVAAAMPRNGWWYPKKFFPVRFTAWKKFFSIFGQFPFPISIPVMLYVRFNGSIPVKKAKGDLFQALKEVIKELKNGAKVWVFPEGGITKDGSIGQGKRGVVFLHQQTEMPVVPVCLNGTFGIISFKTLLFRKKIIVNIGRPIYNLGGDSLEQGVEKIMWEIINLRLV